MEYECTERLFTDAGAQSSGVREKWLSVAGKCPYATYFHTPYWYESVVSGGNYGVIEVSFDDGASALIPVAVIRRFGGLSVDYVSSPCGTYGGWISADALGDDHVLALIEILTSIKNLTLRMSPLIPSSASWLAIEGFTSDCTHTIDLTKGIDALLCGFSRGHRNAINRAAREGVTVKAAETAEEWDRHYDMYMSSVERWNRRPRTVYGRSLFRRIYENRAGGEILWLAVKDGEPIAGTLTFYWNRHVVSWHGSAASEHFGLRPNNLLYWEIFQDAVRRGFEVYDFNPSGGYSGVESFKEHFGAVRVPSPVLTTRTPLRALASRLRSLS